MRQALLFLTLSSLTIIEYVQSFNGIGTRAFTFSPKIVDKPKLILVGGCTGTGKSTFGMVGLYLSSCVFSAVISCMLGVVYCLY